MALSELSTFMAAVRRSESGSYAGNYANRSGDQMGAYGISAANWTAWTSQAGLSGAEWRSRSAQDAVARYKMTQLYNRFSDWRLVEIAWNYGTSAADKVRREGLGAYESMAKNLATRMHGAANAGFGSAPKPPPNLVSQLDATARDAIERGTLSVDQDFAPDLPTATYTPPRYNAARETTVPPPQPSTVLTTQQQATAPTTQEMSTFDKGRLAKSEMHRNMSSILQGLSNAIRMGTQRFQESQSVAPPEETEEETG